MVSEGAGNKPLSVHLSAGCIQLCILPGPVDAIRACLDLLQRGCSFQLPSGNLLLSDSSCSRGSSFLLQSRPSRIPDLRRATRIMEGTFLSVVHCQQPSCSLRHAEKSMPMNPTVLLSFSIMGNNHLQTCLRSPMSDVEALKEKQVSRQVDM